MYQIQTPCTSYPKMPEGSAAVVPLMTDVSLLRDADLAQLQGAHYSTLMHTYDRQPTRKNSQTARTEISLQA